MNQNQGDESRQDNVATGQEEDAADPVSPYRNELECLKDAHVAFVNKVWDMYNDQVMVYSIMHAVHHAMMEFEKDLMDDMACKTFESMRHGQRET